MSNLCDYCGQKPKFGTFNYCGKTCGQAAKANPGGAHGGGGGAQPGNSGRKCAIPKCQKTVFQGSDYCSKTHRDLLSAPGIATACIWCRETRRMTGDEFCTSACKADAMSRGPVLIPIIKADPKHSEILGQFDRTWRHPTSVKPRPTAVHLYKVILATNVMSPYYTYRDAVEAQGNWRSQGRNPGNERRLWHGTKRGCTLGDDPTKLNTCGQSSCSLCSILGTSFLVNVSGSVHTFSRFGRGIYTSETSSKSDDYVQQNQVRSPYKAILSVRLVLGKVRTYQTNQQQLTAPPPGFHSVRGEPGQVLNYDESVVYSNDAIRPSWLVIYK